MSGYIPPDSVVRDGYILQGCGLPNHDGCHELLEAEFNRWVHEQYLRGVQAAQDAVSSVVPYNFELNHDGTEDKLRAAYVEGVHDAWSAIGDLL